MMMNEVFVEVVAGDRVFVVNAKYIVSASPFEFNSAQTVLEVTTGAGRETYVVDEDCESLCVRMDHYAAVAWAPKARRGKMVGSGSAR